MTKENTNNMEIEPTPKNSSHTNLFNLRKQLICLLPNACRNELTISLPREINDQEVLFKTFTTSLETQYKTMKIYILSIRRHSDKLYQLEMNIVSKNTDKQYYYDIVYIIIPKELIAKFENESINHIKFYIGKSKNTKEFVILDQAPTLDMISTKNSEGINRPFACEINLL